MIALSQATVSAIGRLPLGIFIGVVFAIMDLIVPIGPEVATMLYAVVVAFLAAGTVSSIREGLVVGLGAIAGQSLGGAVYYLTYFGFAVAQGAVLYTITLGLIYPLAGIIGGYLGKLQTALKKARRQSLSIR